MICSGSMAHSTWHLTFLAYISAVSLPSRTQHSTLKPTVLHLCGQFTKQNTAFHLQTYSVTPLWSVYRAEHSIPPSNLQCYTSVVSLPSRTRHSTLKPTALHLCGQFTKQNTAFLPQTVKQCYTSVISLPSRTQHSSLKPSVLSPFLNGRMFVCRTYFRHFNELWFAS